MNENFDALHVSPDSSKTVQLCIFCPAQLDESTKPEHVLLNALGGRKTTKCAICSDQNSDFGSTIDKTLTEQVRMLRNMLQLESGTGDPPPGIKNIQSGDRRVNLAKDGAPEIVAKPFTITKLPDGNFNLLITARTEEQLEELIPHMAAALKMDETAFRRLLAKSPGKLVRGYVDPILFSPQFGGPDAIRSMVKSCLVLLATKMGTEALRTDAFAEARTFVLEGGEDFVRRRTSLDSRLLPQAELLEERYGPLFNLIYVRSDSAGRTIAHFTLYNLIAWQLVLAEAEGPHDVQVGLVSNSLNPSDWSDSIADSIDLDFAWLSSPDMTDLFTRGQERLSAAMEYYVETARRREVGEVIKTTMSRHYEPGEQILPDEREERFRAELVERLTRMMLKLPSEEPFVVAPPQKPA